MASAKQRLSLTACAKEPRSRNAIRKLYHSRSPSNMPRTLFCLPVEDTKEGLLLRLPEGGYGCDPEAWAVIEALPDYSPK